MSGSCAPSSAHPPDILLTNYRMLEYLLLRGDGRALFRNHAVRFIVLDEVHTYKGALGTDVACLMRRLRAALEDLDAFSPEDPERVLTLARKLTGSNAGSLEACRASTALPYLLLNWLEDPQSLSGVVERLAERASLPKRTGAVLALHELHLRKRR